MRPISAWSLPRVLALAFGWSALVFLVALLTPPGRFLVGLYRTVQAGGTVGAEMPVAALKLWFALVPALAFGPSAVLLIAWLRARGVSGRNVTG